MRREKPHNYTRAILFIRLLCSQYRVL